MKTIEKLKDINLLKSDKIITNKDNSKKLNSLLTNIQYKLKKKTILNNNIRSNTNIRKKERESRHFVPASKEWKNSVYNYNKNILLDMPHKDKIANKFIKSYFNISPIPLTITKSRRMRDLIKRSYTKQLFVSTPEIKQNNDYANITLYTFDREKKEFYRKLFFLRKWLSESLSKGFKLKKSKNNLITKIKKTEKIKKNVIYKRHIIFLKKLRYNKRKVLKKKLSKYNLKNDLYLKTINNLLSKKKYIVNMFFYKFLKRIISYLFGKKIYFREKKSIFKHKKYVDFGFKAVKKKIIRTKEGKIRHVKPDRYLIIKNSEFNLKLLRSINILLFNSFLINNKKYNTKYIALFKKLKYKYKELIKQNYLIKEVLIIKYLSELYINKFKYYSYLPFLKILLSKIYNKKITLNLIKLKNVYLNSDIFSEAISIKLRRRTRSLSRILRRSFNFVKKIKPNHKYITIQKFKNFTSKKVETYFGKYNVINGNVVNKVFDNMFNYKKLTIIKGILKSVKYKWVTGVRIEAKGRLTRRYAAAKALFKYKYRGTLRNLEFLKNKENDLNSSSVFMLRGDSRPNTQYSLIHSKRRIGAFGIKGWISNS